MHLRCVNCRQTIAVPDGLGRYFDMPVRCHACRRVFTVPPQRPAGRDTLSSLPQHPLDRSVSAQRHHHPIRCPACAAALRLAGRARPTDPVRLVCPLCGVGFRHRPGRRVDRLDILVWIVAGAVLALALVLLAHAEGYIELRNLAATPSLARLGAFLASPGIR